MVLSAHFYQVIEPWHGSGSQVLFILIYLFSHLADAFIQSDLQMRIVIHLNQLCMLSGL